MTFVRLGSLAALTLSISAAIATAQAPYSVINHWKIGGSGGWDYLLADPPAHRLYVTHGPRVEVLDTATGKQVGAITGLKGTHGVALDADGQVGYISDGGGNAVVVFNRKTLAVLASIPAGTNPDGIVFEPVTRTVWAFNGRSNDVTVIDTTTRTAVATIALPGKPEFPQADGKGHVFDNIEDRNSIVALDARSKTLTGTWLLSECDSPSGLAIDQAHERVFAVCDGKKMAIVDTRIGKQTGVAAIGDGPDAAGFDPKRQLAYASSGDGMLAIVDTAHGNKTIQMLPTLKGARTMAYDEGRDQVYVVSAQMGARPEPSAASAHPRPAIVPDTFEVVVIGRK